MATATMVQPPPPPGPPPSTSRRPPPPPSRPPPPPPRPAKRPPPPITRPPSTRLKIAPGPITLIRPKALRDVTAFHEKHQVGQGTYGSVFMGVDKMTGEIVALKRINTEQEENGFPITAIREVKILKALNHTNIVKLKEIVTSKENNNIPKNVFMVFEYLEFDLTGILETREINLTQDHIKSWSQQLLSGVHYMHTNNIIHRDLKASNILINKRGELKIADWGLARSWNSEMTRLTNRVITLWYRPPELLLGCIQYTPKIDMWSVGCIIAEMFKRSGFLKGRDEAAQLQLIFRCVGHPTLSEWPNINKSCPLWKNYEPTGAPLPSQIRSELKKDLPHPHWMTSKAIDLISSLMILNPDKRWSALEALDADYFFDDPIVKPAHKLSMKFAVDSVHEWEARKKHELARERERKAREEREAQRNFAAGRGGVGGRRASGNGRGGRQGPNGR